MILETYRFYYPELKVTQDKILIDYYSWFPLKPLPSDTEESLEQKSIRLKKITQGKEWFLTHTFLYEAITTGILQHYGGTSRCIVTKID